MNFIRNKKLIFCCIVLLFFCFLALSINICWAANDCANRPDEGDLWKEMQMCRKCGDCTLNDFVRLFTNASQWILGIVGSLALLMFIYGGAMFLISAGNAEKVTQAKQIILGAVIGLVIVFASYMIVQFAMEALGIEKMWAVTSWFK